ncbi:outer membrane lipoprotein carrier protein LolA, partial [Burkholderia thailandensis]|nr:outer membrane lipoprotein carrier protein LolA [Burkholderia thailandensis]
MTALLPTPRALRRAARALAVAAALAIVAPAHAADADVPWTLDRLKSTLAQRKAGRATFTETKYLSIAAQPVESSGELVFVAPDHLEK